MKYNCELYRSYSTSNRQQNASYHSPHFLFLDNVLYFINTVMLCAHFVQLHITTVYHLLHLLTSCNLWIFLQSNPYKKYMFSVMLVLYEKSEKVTCLMTTKKNGQWLPPFTELTRAEWSGWTWWWIIGDGTWNSTWPHVTPRHCNFIVVALFFHFQTVHK